MYRKIAPWLALSILAFAAPGCGGGSWSYQVVGTDRDRGAEGEIQVEQIEGGNRMVTARFDHLTPPARHGEGMTAFVMWFRDSRGQASKAAVLEYNEDERTGRATATTPMTQFTIMVTVERSAEVVGPSDAVVFRQRADTE